MDPMGYICYPEIQDRKNPSAFHVGSSSFELQKLKPFQSMRRMEWIIYLRLGEKWLHSKGNGLVEYSLHGALVFFVEPTWYCNDILKSSFGGEVVWRQMIHVLYCPMTLLHIVAPNVSHSNDNFFIFSLGGPLLIFSIHWYCDNNHPRYINGCFWFP